MKNNLKIKKLKNLTYFLVTFSIALVALIGITNEDFATWKWSKIFNDLDISNSSNFSDDIFEGLEAHFINVGKADAIYLKSGEKNILVDSGDKEPHGVVVSYLKKQNVQKLDLVVATHPHRDHIGQMSDVIENFKIDTFIEPNIPSEVTPVTVTYEGMLKSLRNKNVNARLVRSGEHFEFDSVKIDVIGPVSPSDNINNNSIVLRITYKNVSFLLTGDAEKAEESEILKSGQNVKSDVLKVGHHGSNTSTSAKFLTAVAPKYAVISVLSDKPGSPAAAVVKRLEKFCGKNIYRTDQSGTIIIFTNGEEISVKTEKQ